MEGFDLLSTFLFLVDLHTKLVFCVCAFSDAYRLIADTIIPYALLISPSVIRVPGKRVSLKEVATVPQNMVEYKSGCGSFYIQPSDFKVLGKCSQPIGECFTYVFVACFSS